MYDEEEDEEDQLMDFSATKLQSLARVFLIRSRIIKKINARYEKILDPKRHKYYYYDKELDTSSWRKPRLLLNGDIKEIAPTYTPEQATTKIQSRIRMVLALLRIRLLYQSTIISSLDEASGSYYYYNPKSEATMWDLPSFMGNRMDYTKKKPIIKSPKNVRKPKKKELEVEEEEESNEEEYEEEEIKEDTHDETASEAGSEESLDSTEIREKRRQARRFPRSKVQGILDKGEDNIPETFEFDLSHIGASRFTSRLYDLVELRQLNLSHNKLTRISKDIQYLVNLTTLDFSYNKIDIIPKEMEELKQLSTLNMSNNKLMTFPGQIWKLANMTSLNMSHNLFPAIPIETGNLELLKELGVWDIGIGLVTELLILDASYNKIFEWPSQIEQLTKLVHLDLSNNQIDMVPNLIGLMKCLEYVDLSNNFISSIAPELYTLTALKYLALHQNRLTDLPILKEHHIDDGPRPEYVLPQLTVLTLHHNALSYIDERLAIFVRLERLDLSHNKIISIAGDAISMLTHLQMLDASHNSLVDMPTGLGACTHLTDINVSYNLLREMPLSFIKLVKLVNINLRNNQMTEVSGKTFAMLNDLERLELQYNKLPALPPLIYTLKKVTHLDVSHNDIASVHETMGGLVSATYINMSFNQIPSIPDSVSEITHLAVLELKSNSLTSLPSSMSVLKHLRRVTLSKNDLERSPLLLNILPHLISSNLSWNCNMKGCQNINWNQLTEQFNAKQSIEFISIPIFCRKLFTLMNEVDRVSASIDAKNVPDALDGTIKDKKHAIYSFELSPEERAKYQPNTSKDEIDDELASFQKVTSPMSSTSKTKKEKNKKPKKQKVKKVSSLTTRTIAWHQKLKEHFAAHLISNLNRTDLSSDPTKDFDRLIVNTQLSKVETRCSLHLSTALQAINKYRGYSNRMKDFIVHSDASDSLDMQIIETALENGSEYQDSIDAYQLLLHEINAMTLLQHMRHMLQNPLPEIDEDDESVASSVVIAPVQEPTTDSKKSGLGSLKLFGGSNKSERAESPPPKSSNASTKKSPKQKSKSIAKPSMAQKQLLAMAFGEESIEEKINAVGKTILSTNFTSTIPSLFHFPRILKNEATATGLFDASNDRFIALMFSTYVDMAKVLVKKAAAIAQSIRKIEKRGSVKVTCLDIAQREGCDFLDIMLDVYEGLVATVIQKELASERQSLAQKKKDNVNAILSAIVVNTEVEGDEGHDDHPVEGEPTTHETEGGEHVTDSETVEHKPEEEVEPPKKNSSSKSLKAKDAKVETVNRAPPPPPPVKLSTQLPSMSPDNLIIIDPIATSTAESCIEFLASHRTLTLTWAYHCVDIATNILKLNNYDLDSTVFRLNHSHHYSGLPDWLREGAIKLCKVKSRIFAGLQLYDKAIDQYRKVIRLTKQSNIKWIQVDMIKLHIAQGNFMIAQEQMQSVMERFMLKPMNRTYEKLPDILELLRVDKELSLLYYYIDYNVTLLTGSHQLFKHEQHRVFSVKPNGLLNLNCDANFPDIKYGRTLSDKKIKEKMAKQKMDDKADLELYESRRTFRAFIDDEKAKTLKLLSMFDHL